MDKIPLKAGSPVEGDEFYGREKELQYVWEYHISKGVSVLLSAPRRVGKTSFSKKLIERAKQNGWKTLYLDLEGSSTESDFVKLFKEKLQKENWLNTAGNTILKIFASIKELKIAEKKLSINIDVWRNDAYGKIKKLIESEEKILIVIDELTIFLDHLLKQENGRERVEYFLEWLRNFRQTTTSCWIFCSSVGIENFALVHQLSKHFNDFISYSIGPFSEDEARDFILRLDVNEYVKFTNDHIQYILNKLDWYLPFFIKILVEKVNSLVDEKRHLSREVIDEAYKLLIKGIQFNTWIDRLKLYDELQDTAKTILKLCVSPRGRSRNDLLINLSAKKSEREKVDRNLSQVLRMLINDGYLTEHKRKYIFRSPLIKDFWYDRFIK